MNNNRKSKEHTDDCVCRKCIYVDYNKVLEKALSSGEVITDKKGRIFKADEIGYKSYKRLNPHDFELER